MTAHRLVLALTTGYMLVFRAFLMCFLISPKNCGQGSSLYDAQQMRVSRVRHGRLFRSK